MVHADTPTLLSNQASGNTDEQVQIYTRLTKRLVAAGAERVVVTSIAGHFCIEEFKRVSPLPVVDLIQSVDQEVIARKLGRIGILGTETVMRSHFYGGLSEAQAIPLPEQMVAHVHKAYVEMATHGVVTDQQRGVFDAACDWFLETGRVDAIMLGGTDLALVYSDESEPFPILDCAAIHADRVVAHAMVTN